MLSWLQGLVDPFAPARHQSPTTDPWRFIAAQLHPFRGVLAASLGLSAAGAVLEVWLIFYAGHLVDRLAATGPDALWTALGPELLGVAVLVLLVRPLVALLREGMDDIAFRPNAEALVTWRSHRHVLRQSVGWFQSDFAGRIAAYVRQTGAAAPGAVYAIVHTLVFVAFYIAGSAWLMAAIDPRLVVPILAWVAIHLGFMAWIVPRYRRASEAWQRAEADVTGLLVDSYGNIDTLKVFGGAEDEDRAGKAALVRMRTAFFGTQRVEVTINATMSLLGGVLLVALIGYGLILWHSGDAGLGLIAVAVALSFRITGMGEWLLDAVSNLFRHLGALRQTLRTVGQPIAIDDAPNATELAVTEGAIRMIGLTHHYGRGDGGLAGVSVAIGGGERVALVGPSGAGKSSLVNLLLRFHEIEAGTIEIDGQDITRVTQASLRRHISVVAQSATLLHRSVRENIAPGDDVPLSAIETAAAAAHADAFIRQLRDETGRMGYDAHVGERGVKLSGGQRQRIALARAILKRAPILILDEATSALDSGVEAAIAESLEAVMAGRTVIAIAHRLSTIARMDRIVVLDGGRIVEVGTHAALVASDGLYARLWAQQSGGFIGTGR